MTLLVLLSKNALKTSFENHVGAILFLVGKFLRFIFYFLFVYYLLSNTKTLAGYTLNQTLLFFIVFNIVDTTTQLIFREVYRFRTLVVNGELDGILIKPYHPFIRILVGGPDPLDMVMLVLYCGLFAYFLPLAVSVDIGHIFLFLILLINTFMLAASFHIVVLALGILTTEVDHAMMIYRDVTRVGTLPIDIYKEPLRSIFTFILPVGIMMTFPVKALLGMLDYRLIFACVIITSGMLLVSLRLWHYALKKYQSWGG